MTALPRLLVTGASGFVGRQAILSGHQRFNILATGRGRRPDWLPDAVQWAPVDLLDRNAVASLPNDIPYVLHLASETVPSQFASFDPVLESVEITQNLTRHLQSCRFLMVSSCLVYSSSAQPIGEEQSINPRGKYGLAKVLAEAVTLKAQSIEGIVARPFNHIGPYMRPDLVIPSIVRRLKRAKGGEPVEMQGMDSIRDFLDVSDIVEAYFCLLELPELPARTFNVASGIPTRISDIVKTAAVILNKPIGEIRFSQKPNSGDDTSTIRGDARLLRDATGWKPAVTLENSLGRLIAELV